MVLRRAGEGALAVAEQLALEQRLGDGGAVDGQERGVGAGRGAVDAARHQLLAGAGLALDQDRDRRGGGALHQPEDLGHGRRAADDLVEAVAMRHVAAQRADLDAQQLLRGLHAREQAGVLDRHGDAAGECFEEGEVVVREGQVAAAVEHLDDADDALVGSQRRAQQRAGGEAGIGVDAAEEARVRLHVVDVHRLAAAQHPAGDAAVGGEAQLEQAGEDGGIFLGDEREVELAGLRIEQQHRGAHRIEHLAALGDDEREQLVEVDARRERTGKIVEQPKARRAFDRRTVPVERHGPLPSL